MIISAICLLLVADLWQQNRERFDGLDLLVGDTLCRTVGVALLFLRGGIPDWLSIVLANTLLVLGPWLGLRGLERFVGRRGPHWQNWVLLTVFPLLHAYFTYGVPSLTARNLNVFGALLFIYVQCLVLLLWRVNAAQRVYTSGLGLVFGGLCLWSVFWLGWVSINPITAQSFFRSGPIAALNQISIYMFFFLLAYSLSLMINRRLLTMIQHQEQKFSKAFHSSPYAISLSRLSDGRLIEVNARFEKLIGKPLAEILNQPVEELGFWLNLEDRARLIKALRQQGRVGSLELQFRNSAGEIITGLLSAELITIDDEPCILASINDISDRKQAEIEREALVAEREKALADVKILRGLLPICASCKKIRDDFGNWDQIENYIATHSQADFTHSICPTCMRKLYPEYAEKPDAE
ncbi:MAG: putative diguanylate cyclase [Deltaproteobacteria bacterium ADurb.Bin510]|nr:MAG: putative diguanylate cyclase [Deltaproteobacteria bacterium ADurb.Bin510]